MKKKKNIWIYFIKMFIIFMILFILQSFGMEILYNSFTFLKYGVEIINQSIWVVLVIIIVFSFKNSYIFKQEKEKNLKSVKLGWPLLLIAFIFLVMNIIIGITEGAQFSIPIILNLAIYCILIGMVEEFLCRGWLLNEFLERFSDSKKNIIISIILSSLIFGFIHLFNIAMGQSLIDTLTQMVHATILGIALSLIYYKTKNIWSVVIIHAIWDFCLMIGESTYFVNCIPGTETNTIIIYTFISTLVVCSGTFIICYWLYKQTNLNDNSSSINNKMYYILPIVATVLYVVPDFVAPKEYKEYYICPTYEYKTVEPEFDIQYSLHSKYDLKYSTNQSNASIANLETKYSFSLLQNEETLAIELRNNITNEKIELTQMFGYDYLIIENEMSFMILIQNDYNKVLYGTFNKDDISNNTNYLEYVKNQLKEYIVPEIRKIGLISIGKSNYKYALIQTMQYDKLYFDKDGTLFIMNIEE